MCLQEVPTMCPEEVISKAVNLINIFSESLLLFSSFIDI